MTGERFASLNAIVQSLCTDDLISIREAVTTHMHRFSADPNITSDAWVILDNLLAPPIAFERIKGK